MNFLTKIIESMCSNIPLYIGIVFISTIAAIVCILLYFVKVISQKTMLYSVIAFVFLLVAYEAMAQSGSSWKADSHLISQGFVQVGANCWLVR
jgi:hypothetical protein